MGKRILIFIGAALLLYFVVLVVGGAVVGGMAGAHAPNPAAGPRLAVQASAAFAFKYRPIAFAGAVVVGTLIAFGGRLIALICTAPIAIFGFLWLQKMGPTERTFLNNTPIFAKYGLSVPGVTAPPRVAMSGRASLLTPVTLRTTYGQVTLAKGSVVTILSENDGTATVKGPDGTPFIISLSQLQQ
jgi:hypothetical protein